MLLGTLQGIQNFDLGEQKFYVQGEERAPLLSGRKSLRI
jgi:hypothetical protein